MSTSSSHTHPFSGMLKLAEIIKLLVEQSEFDERPRWEQSLLSDLANKAELWALSFDREAL